jgi:hypothetical protein
LAAVAGVDSVSSFLMCDGLWWWQDGHCIGMVLRGVAGSSSSSGSSASLAALKRLLQSAAHATASST